MPPPPLPVANHAPCLLLPEGMPQAVGARRVTQQIRFEAAGAAAWGSSGASRLTGRRASVGDAAAAGLFQPRQAFSRQVRLCIPRCGKRLTALLLPPVALTNEADRAWAQHRADVRQAEGRRRAKEVRVPFRSPVPATPAPQYADSSVSLSISTAAPPIRPILRMAYVILVGNPFAGSLRRPLSAWLRGFYLLLAAIRTAGPAAPSMKADEQFLWESVALLVRLFLL